MSRTETDICDQLISPAIWGAGWDRRLQVRREYTFTDGRVHVRGKTARRGKKRRADYLLSFEPRLPLAVVEAKDDSHGLGDGMPQALEYAEALDLPFAFSSNGSGFLFHDRTGQSSPVEREISMEEFPTPEELWKRYLAWKGFNEEEPEGGLLAAPYFEDGSGREPRYYQRTAIQRTLEAVAAGQKKVLLVMATGTGKTFTAFQIIWRLWKAKRAKRILFLVDRNILADQTIVGDFKPFGSAMTKITNRTVDKSYEIYLALYQAVTGEDVEDDIYKQFSPDFFDLVVVDECHRGSARDNSAWRRILDYFESAVQLGMTATPKETVEVSTQTYFGDPVYTYSLRQGIADGFLAPYKVARVDLDRDLQGWRPAAGMVDDLGEEIEDRIYNQADMDRVLILNERTKRVAEKIVEYMARTDPYGKTIVFCEDIDHAERMRSALVNQVAASFPEEAENTDRFVVRITGDSYEGKARLDDFIHPEKRYPVIATTSKLLSTGVDARTCKLVVLDQNIRSVTEFKQIIGRGTRIHEEAGKLWFTILDFRKATELFADPSFDGDPVVIFDPDLPEPDPGDGDGGGEGGGGEGDDPEPDFPDDGDGSPRRRYRVSGVTVSVISERVFFLDADGKLITESIRDYVRRSALQEFRSLDRFLQRWSEAERKTALLAEMGGKGIFLEDLEDAVGEGFDPFDLVCHVAFDAQPRTRAERAAFVRGAGVFAQYGETARAVLEGLLDKYADQGIEAIEDMKVLRLTPFSGLGTPVELVRAFGGRAAYDSALQELERALYQQAS